MSETREQYRDRLAQILDAEYAEAFRTPEERASWDMVRPEWKQKMGDMAEAVYAQALNDVLDWFVAHPIESDLHAIVASDPVTAAGILVASMKRFAKERGISLEDES